MKVSIYKRNGTDLSETKLSMTEMKELGQEVRDEGISVRALGRKYNVSQRKATHWVAAAEGKTAIYAAQGRPKLLDETDYTNILKWLDDKGNCVSIPDFKQELLRLIQEKKKNNGCSKDSCKMFSNHTWHKILNELGVQIKNGEATTQARYKAMRDVKNAVSFAACVNGLIDIHPALHFNVDATTFEVGNTSRGRVKVLVPVGPQKTNPKLVENGQSVTYYIKYYLLMSASGHIGHSIYIIADEGMKKDEIKVYKVHGLCVAPTLSGFGYVVFCKSRAANVAFYRWFNTTVLFEMVDMHRNIFGPEKPKAVLQLDGEEVQIRCYADNDIIEFLKTNNIMVVKPPGSTTEATQPCDTGNCFKAAHTKLNRCKDKHVKNNVLLTVLESILGMQMKYTGHAYTNDHQHSITYGILRVQMAIQSVWTNHIVRDSFERAGVFPCDTEQILSQFAFRLTADERRKIDESLPELTNRMKTNGELYESDFDEFGICDGENKSKYVVSRRRTVILTNEMFIQNEKTKRMLSNARRAKRKGNENTQVNENQDFSENESEVEVSILNNALFVTQKRVVGAKSSFPTQSGAQILQSVKRSKITRK